MNLKKETIELVANHRLPSYNEIPNVGLYLEQTAKYINEFLEPIMDTAITGSMISNYVKKKLVPNPVKKMYYREHIAQLIIIAVLKSILALDKIDLILKIDSEHSLEESYDLFSAEFEFALRDVFGIETQVSSAENMGDKEELLKNIVNTIARKIHVDKTIAALS